MDRSGEPAWEDRERRDRIAQWAFDTRQILGRFHLWLDDVEETWLEGRPYEGVSFVGEGLEKAFVMAAAVTALGTRLFGRYGEGRGLDKGGINRVKKDADAVSAYALSEALWYLTRHLPENHAVMVSLGEGLMPKVGETPEMGSNPLLGFGRVYARPQVARFLDRRIHRLLNDPAYTWDHLWAELQLTGVTVWGSAIDTLENTSRFAKGEATGPLTVLHLFDQPLRVMRPYEGYVGNLVLPRPVVEHAIDKGVLISYLTPRPKVLEVILSAYPELSPERIHVWTLGGKSRAKRIGSLWESWRTLGVHVVEDGWVLPRTGLPSFNDSGTWAPTFQVGTFRDEAGLLHLFLSDGYAASAEAIQAASLDPVLNLHSSLCLFSSRFDISHEREHLIMRLDAEDPGFGLALADILQTSPSPEEIEDYRAILRNARDAGMPLNLKVMSVDDFFPLKKWETLAIAGFMLDDPYTGAPGIVDLGGGAYRVTVRAMTQGRILQVALTLRFMEPMAEGRLVFLPLLDRFYAGQDHRSRPVKVSDSGRIRNELQTLASEALTYLGDSRIRVDLARVDDAVLPPDKKALILDVLRWYKENHPIWFAWLELA